VFGFGFLESMVFHSCFSTGLICKLRHLMSHWNGLDVAAVGKAEGPFAPKCPANGSSQVKFHFQRIENQTDNWPVKYFNAIYQNASENCSPILSGWLTG